MLEPVGTHRERAASISATPRGVRVTKSRPPAHKEFCKRFVAMRPLETRQEAPNDDPTPPAAPACSSLSACIDRFRCMNAGALQCTANTTCQAQLADVDCLALSVK